MDIHPAVIESLVGLLVLLLLAYALVKAEALHG